jgi:hypothetical protein
MPNNLHLHDVPQEFYDELRKAAALTTIKGYVIRAVEEQIRRDKQAARQGRRPGRKHQAA